MLEKLPPSENAILNLGGIKGQINSLDGINREIFEVFSHVLRIIGGIKFIMQELKRTLKDLEKDLAEN